MSLPRELLLEVVQEVFLGVLVFDPATGQCLFANKMAREILELESTENSPDDFRLSAMKAEVRSPQYKTFDDELLQNQGFFNDIFVRKFNGHTMIANVGLKPIEFEGFNPSRMVIVMLQDVTFQKKLQREIQNKQDEIRKAYTELLEQNRQLKELDQAKDRFFALTAHELRTPLSAVVATAEVLALGLQESDQQRDELIKSMLEQGNQLMELVNDILDFAKIRAGKMDYYIEWVDIQNLVEKTIEQYKGMAEQYNVHAIFQPTSEPVMAYVDALRMREVLNNVVSNAIKYNRPGGKVEIKLLTHQDFAEIQIADTGKGISDSEKSAVFSEFETAHTASHHKGTGLGMPISLRLTEAMGGKIWFESQMGKGTIFYIKIPQTKILKEEWYRTRHELEHDLTKAS